MTDNLASKVKELKQMILDSEEYRNFDLYRRLLKEVPELFDQVNQFRHDNFMLQISGEIQNKEKAEEIVEKNKDLFNNSLVTPFLNAELVLCKMLQDINEMLVDEIDMDVDFLK
ncbi:MAG: YlbF family regulator [Lachnospiraceae bacterium]|nr:YlbF family regulator [Lachnospiraceae bacterium]